MYAWNKPYHIEPNFETQIHATKPLPVEELPRSSFLSPPRRAAEINCVEMKRFNLELSRRVVFRVRRVIISLDLIKWNLCLSLLWTVKCSEQRTQQQQSVPRHEP